VFKPTQKINPFPGSVMTAACRLTGQEFAARNGGPHFKFTEAISFVVKCDGLSSQLVPTALDQRPPDQDIAGLQAVYRQG
jgi:hypothetical protein